MPLHSCVFGIFPFQVMHFKSFSVVDIEDAEGIANSYMDKLLSICSSALKHVYLIPTNKIVCLQIELL